MKHLEIYCDGSCLAGVGGWCALAVHKNRAKVFKGSVPSTTNNRMELRAILEGLKALDPSKIKGWKVSIYSDSAYAVGVITGEFTAKSNIDLLISIHNLQLGLKYREIEFNHIPRNSVKWIAYADALAKEMAGRAKNE